MAYIETEMATAVISIYAAHPLSFQPRGERDLLWVSKKAIYESGKSIRGGIPIIWPWFGAHPTDSMKQSHGFARQMMWRVAETAVNHNNHLILKLALAESATTKAQWPHPFHLTLTIIVGDSLSVTLTIENQSDIDFSYTAALHTYFNISDIKNISISGLENAIYLDKLDELRPKKQSDGIQFQSEVDRIYINTTAVCKINDSGFNRAILVSKQGSCSTVVWNPWIDKAKAMSDFGDDEYLNMVCVETANAANDLVTLAPHEKRSLTTTITLAS